jgi:DNA-directed RNA polymerase specialized sigma24 family protein
MPISSSDLAALLAGERGAWDAFVPKAAAVMRAPIRRVLAASPDDIGDVLQDCFLRLVRDDYRLLRRFDPGRATLSTWLGVIATSAAIDHLRRKSPAADPLEDHADSLAAPDAPPGLDPALPLPPELLTPRQALILKLIYEDDRDVEEVAGILGIGAPSVRSLRHKAILRLREFFRARGGYE